MFQSPTFGKLRIEDVPDKILAFFERNRDRGSLIRIIIGTDSQNFDHTKVVTVIAVVCEGHGGIFFYEVSRQDLIRDVRTKLHFETYESLSLAEKLVGYLEEDRKYEEMYLSCPLSIHVDAGNSNNGKTKELIPELVAWIRTCGYDCSVKPDSFVASTIADRISK